jgi:hypothetical protein
LYFVLPPRSAESVFETARFNRSRTSPYRTSLIFPQLASIVTTPSEGKKCMRVRCDLTSTHISKEVLVYPRILDLRFERSSVHSDPPRRRAFFAQDVEPFGVRALALDPSQPFSSYLRTRFGDEDGLPSSVVHDIVQSKDGFLWVSFTFAVSRYDSPPVANTSQMIRILSGEQRSSTSLLRIPRRRFLI